MQIKDQIVNQRLVNVFFDNKDLHKILIKAAAEAAGGIDLTTFEATAINTKTHISKKDMGTNGFLNRAEVNLIIPIKD